MKALFLILFSIFIFVQNYAQIPNSSFENWMNMGNYEVPENWYTLNEKFSSSNVFTVTKESPGKSGNSYIKVTSKTINQKVIGGIAITAFPIQSSPQRLSGFCQHMGYSSEKGCISVALTKWNVQKNKRDTVALGRHELFGMIMNWSEFNIQLMYLNTDQPDSALITLQSSGLNPSAQDYLSVDDLSFQNQTANILEFDIKKNYISIYPNPATMELNIEINNLEEESIFIKMFNTNGQEVFFKSYNTNNNFINEKLDVSHLLKGIYFLSTSNSNNIQKIIIN